MELEVRSEIYRLGLTVTGLDANNFFYARAQQSITVDSYCVYSIIANTMSRDTGSKFEDIYFQFNIYATNLSDAETIEQNLISVFDDSESNWTLINFSVLNIVREFRTELRPFDKWQIAIRYHLKLMRN